MINRVVLIGRITRDIEVRKTNSGMSVVGFTIAVDDNRKDQNGNKTTSFINCTAFGSTADFMNNYTHKGSLIGVEGRLQQRSYERKDGTKASTIDVIVDNISLLEKKGDSNGNTQSMPIDQPDNSEEENDITGSELTDSDLPF